ncbi:MAG: hypothetical protein JEZ08_00590 [Clostridiales bacterium]|nr:hypothetical protein [Clostridiales bacterium]
MKRVKWFFYSLLVVVLLLVLTNRSFYQEGNPLPLIIGIVQLELSDDKMVRLDYDDKISYIIKKDTFDSEFNLISQSLDEYIKLKVSQGWVFNETIGSGLIFESEGCLMTTETKMYSKYYMIINEPVEVN